MIAWINPPTGRRPALPLRGGARRHQSVAFAGGRKAPRRRFRAGLMACAFVAGVMLLIAGSGDARAAEPRILLLRGWFGVFSTGLDTLADELKAKGLNVEVAGHLHWRTALDEILQARAAGDKAPIVLVGHSQGANNVIDMARELAAHNIPVALLVTLAPFMQEPIPGNVVRAVNYYQTPGWGAPLTVDQNFRGKLVNNDVSGDWSVTHISIDKNARIQADIAREILAVPASK